MTDKQSRFSKTPTVFPVIGGIIAIWASMTFAIYANLTTWGARGNFGDMFGAVNALFSGLALAGIVYAILLQQEELALQRAELSRTARAQEKSEEALRDQASIQNLAAKLSALSAILSHQDNAAHSTEGLERQRIQRQAEEIVGSIRRLIGESVL